MKDMKLSRVYAKAIYDLANEKNAVLEVLDMLNTLIDLVNENEGFKTILNYPIISNEEKIKLVNLALQFIDSEHLDILNYLIDKNRISEVFDIRDQYLDIYYEMNNQLIVTGIFPKELSEIQKENLVKKLEKLKNKKILLHLKVDESLIGGGIVRINDEVIDGSLKTQLESFRKSF